MEDDLPTVTVAQSEPPRRQPEAMVGQRYGRYRITELIGRGGMGAVYAGIDELLLREVAIKVLSRRSRADAARLLREAQALAALSHPNVVTVYEVGVERRHPFIVMERVRGRSMGDWLRDAPPWPEVVEILRNAGHGLAAAHEAGLVHRDFKPANVIIGNDGRPRVLDFGLVVVGDSGPPSTVTFGGNRAQEVGSRRGDLTADGFIMGTPAYMAPEQFDNRDVGPATDQWAFCITLYYGVYGQRPFALGTLEELRLRVRAGLGPKPTQGNVPTWLWHVIRRGLSSDPTERWPSMHALLRQLDRPTTYRRRAWALGGVIGLALGATLVWGGPAEQGECAGSISEQWDDEARQRVKDTFIRTAQSDEFILRELDRYAERWEKATASVCDPELRKKAPNPPELDRGVACLVARRREFTAVVEALTHGDRHVISRSGDLLDGLPPASWCTKVQYLESSLALPRDPEIAAAVAEVQHQLEEVRMLIALDRGVEAGTLAAELVANAEATGYPPVIVDATLQVGELQRVVGDTPRAIADLQDAYWAAIAIDHDRAAARAAMAMVEEISRGGDYAHALEWVRHARAIIERRDPALAHLVPRIDRVEAGVLIRVGRFDDANTLLDHAVTTLAAEQAPRPMEIASCHMVRGMGERIRGHREDAVRWLEKGTSAIEEIYGAHHSRVATGLVNLGLAHIDADSIETGREVLARAVAIEERVLGEDHRDIPPALMALAHAERSLDRMDRARTLFIRALDIYIRDFGSDNINVAYALEGLAMVEADSDDHAAAIPLYERVVALRESGGLAPTWLAQAQFGLARSLRAVGRDHERGLELARQALATYETKGDVRAEDAVAIRAWLDAE